MSNPPNTRCPNPSGAAELLVPAAVVAFIAGGVVLVSMGFWAIVDERSERSDDCTDVCHLRDAVGVFYEGRCRCVRGNEVFHPLEQTEVSAATVDAEP
jgi:hypothetical protein